MGPILKDGLDPMGPTTYVGDGADVPTFNGKIKAFSGSPNLGSGWPYYIPVYFADRAKENPDIWKPLEDRGPDGPKSPSCSFINPFTDANPPITPYLLPKIPGTANLLIESYRIGGFHPYLVAVSPPLLSSQPSNFATIPNYDTNPRFSR